MHLFYVHLIITNFSFPYSSVYFTCLDVVPKQTYENARAAETLIRIIRYNSKSCVVCANIFMIL